MCNLTASRSATEFKSRAFELFLFLPTFPRPLTPHERIQPGKLLNRGYAHNWSTHGTRVGRIVRRGSESFHPDEDRMSRVA